MKTIKTLLTVTGAVLVLGAVGASAALAHEWRDNGVPVYKAEEVKSTSPLTFEDKIRRFEVSCTLYQKGTVSPGGKDEITSILSEAGAKKVPCTVVVKSGWCEKEPEIEAANLPWAGELVTVEGGLRDEILKKTPEWKVTCTGYVAGKITESCIAGLNSAIQNVSPFVDATFDEKTPAGSCAGEKEGRFIVGGTAKWGLKVGVLEAR
jgi:hypothetical protein